MADKDKKEDKKPKAEKKAEPKAEEKAPEAEKPQEQPKDDGVKRAPETFKVLLGEKVGMSQVFTDDGSCKAVTIVKAGPCAVVRVKTADGKDGYSAVTIGFGRVKHVSKPDQGQFKKAGVEPTRCMREFRVADVQGFEAGQTVDIQGRFTQGDYVDVQGVSKGKGFAGAMKRHGFGGLPASHGASDKERSPGSLTSRRSLGRVLPGQRMAGHMGVETITTQKIEVVQVDPDRNLLYLNGSVPGTRGGLITVRETVKSLKHSKDKKAPSKKKQDAREAFLNKGKKKRG